MKIKLPDLLSAIILVLALLYLWVSYNHAPTNLPANYNVEDVSDAAGLKSSAILLAVIMFIVHIGLGVLSTHPTFFHYPFNVTNENDEQIYSTVSNMVKYLRLCINTILAIVIYDIINDNVKIPVVIIILLCLCSLFIATLYIRKLKKYNE
ncbi:hypothetical protein [Porphyromonas pogonae]|uniref:hypothetical protein n=1 Tax=Porphyromonas pogonae TaxID=867595 RepID=UPI002E76F50F|nr:hypothetical protein [Porphyromonas pogonae]